jgi:hypothetical protein
LVSNLTLNPRWDCAEKQLVNLGAPRGRKNRPNRPAEHELSMDGSPDSSWSGIKWSNARVGELLRWCAFICGGCFKPSSPEGRFMRWLDTNSPTIFQYTALTSHYHPAEVVSRYSPEVVFCPVLRQGQPPNFHTQPRPGPYQTRAGLVALPRTGDTRCPRSQGPAALKGYKLLGRKGRTLHQA